LDRGEVLSFPKAAPELLLDKNAIKKTGVVEASRSVGPKENDPANGALAPGYFFLRSPNGSENFGAVVSEFKKPLKKPPEEEPPTARF
jgi:hypothetical protein